MLMRTQNESWLKKVCIVLQASPHSCSSHKPLLAGVIAAHLSTPQTFLQQCLKQSQQFPETNQPTPAPPSVPSRQQVLLRTYRFEGQPTRSSSPELLPRLDTSAADLLQHSALRTIQQLATINASSSSSSDSRYLPFLFVRGGTSVT
jgi:hypothetical protein